MTTTTTFAGLVAWIIGYINDIVLVLGALALLLFMWGVVMYIFKPADKQRRRSMMWSLLTLFILFSIWGIIRLTCVSFLGGTTCGADAVQQYQGVWYGPY